jgi:hypothetical protein
MFQVAIFMRVRVDVLLDAPNQRGGLVTTSGTTRRACIRMPCRLAFAVGVAAATIAAPCRPPASEADAAAHRRADVQRRTGRRESTRRERVLRRFARARLRGGDRLATLMRIQQLLF